MRYSSLYLTSLAIVGAVSETTTFTEYLSTTTIIETISSPPPGVEAWSEPSSTISSVDSTITGTNSEIESVIPSDIISETSTYSNWSISSIQLSDSAHITQSISATSISGTESSILPVESSSSFPVGSSSIPIDFVSIIPSDASSPTTSASSSIGISQSTSSETNPIESNVSIPINTNIPVQPSPSLTLIDSQVDPLTSTLSEQSSVVVLPTLSSPSSSQITPAPSSTTEETTLVSSTSSSTTLGTFEAAILEAHNQKRALHGVPDLVWDQDIADWGANYAATAFNCNDVQLIHSNGPYGENLGAGNFGSDVGVVDAWYDEIVDYDFSNPGYSSATGHFTQVVWKSTSKLGCARVLCDNAWSQYTICEYTDQRGNVIGTDPTTGKSYFELNVVPPL